MLSIFAVSCCVNVTSQLQKDICNRLMYTSLCLISCCLDRNVD